MHGAPGEAHARGVAPFAGTFSVIVPSIGRDPGLPELMESLAAQTLARDRFEILVGLSGPEPSARIRETAARCGARLIPIGVTRGPGAARNCAAREARHEFLAFTEDDCTPEPDWLARAAAALEADATLDVLVGRTVKPGRRPVHREQSGTPLYLPANLFVRRAVFERLGGYREDYFDPASGVYFREDSDFGFTLEEAGARIVPLDDAIVTHPEEHERPADGVRWARRHLMDPLLERRHPRLFRERIEVHRLGPIVVRRPTASASQGVVLGVLLVLFATLMRWPLAVAIGGCVALGGWLVVWAKWSFRPWFIGAVLIVPFVLTWALLRGTWRAMRLSPALSPPAPDASVGADR